MDDATASDNCGELTIEVSSETIMGNAAGNYVIVRTFMAATMQQQLGHADHHGQDTTALSSLRPCRLYC